MEIISYNTEETMALGQRLAKTLPKQSILCLYGDLGSGKTTFVKGLAEGLGIESRLVNSPTFVLLNVYQGKRPLYHFDFYRLQSTEEIAAIGYDEFLYGEGIAVIEWSERFGPFLPSEHLRLEFIFKNETERLIKIEAKGEKYKEILKSASWLVG